MTEKGIAVTLDSANDSFQSTGANMLLNIILEIYLKRVFFVFLFLLSKSYSVVYTLYILFFEALCTVTGGVQHSCLVF